MANINAITQRQLFELNRRFQAVAADFSAGGRPSPLVEQIVLINSEGQNGNYDYPEGAFRYYPLKLRNVCRGNGLTAIFDCYLPEQAHPASVRVAHGDLTREINLLKGFKDENVARWNVMQLEAAKLLGQAVPAKGKYGVSGHVVDAIFKSPDEFAAALDEWHMPEPV